ncbi:MAG: hypothetical protein K0U40_05270 [Betaproteobacteria bacterium]|nr:hypothetical protein [Betaproteobacteria bacterium]
MTEQNVTLWNAGQPGTRTIVCKLIDSWFWNNFNFHIGHHVYLAVLWYELQAAYAPRLSEIES